MADQSKQNHSRRDFLRLIGLTGAGVALAACASSSPPAAQTEPSLAASAGGSTAADASASAGPSVEPTAARVVPRGQAKDVPRNRSLVIAYGGSGDLGIANPYAAGFNHQQGMAALLEPLYFYSAFSDQTTPWLADGDPQYNADSTDVTIKMRKGVEWSDGTPFTAKDVAFTLNMLRDPKNAALTYAKDMNLWVKDAQAVDDGTLKITFTKTAPRFVFDFLAFKNDLGVFIVPEHIFKDQADIANFLFYDPAKSWPVVTAPYKIVDWTVQQRLMDVRPDWWAAKTGFAELPKVERIVTVPYTDDTNAAQQLINNELDSSLDLRPPVIKTVVEQNQKIVTHTGRQSPYGYEDWWPQSLYFNCEVAPFNDADIRRAVNHAIDRKQIVEIGYEGAGTPSYLPLPNFPSLKKYIDAAQALLQKYPTDAQDTAKVDEIMQGKGYAKDNDGLWAKDGQRLDATIYGFAINADYGAVLAEQLRQAGFDASFQQPPDSYTRMADGTGKMFLFGFAQSIADPFPSMDLMHSRRVSPTGTAGEVNARWKNADYDKIVDQMSLLPVSDERQMPLFLQAMEIYLRELPHLPIVKWLHRVPYNTNYWTGWSTQDDPYIPGAFWFKTFPLILHKLKPTS